MKECKFFLSVSFSLFSLFLYAQQAKVEVTNDPCGSCKASTNGVLCGRCGSAMNIEREVENTNPITKKTTYSYALKCSKDNHSMSCNSNLKISRSQDPPSSNYPQKAICPICKRELSAEGGYLIDLYVWETCRKCNGKGYVVYYPQTKAVCPECSYFAQIPGKTGQALYKKNKIWQCPNFKHGKKYFSLNMKELKIRTILGRECLDETVRINK